MAKPEVTVTPLVQLGVLLSVLCAGVAGGALLGAPGKQLSARGAAAPATVVRESPARERSSTPDSSAMLLSGVDQVDPPSELPAAIYAPVDGATGGASWTPAAESREVEPAHEPPPASTPGANANAGLATAGADSLAVEPAPAAHVREQPRRDNVATLSRATAAGAMLFAVASGDETVLFDVGVPGARALPENIAGRWAWAETCLPIEVEISQLPGGGVGAVRGVGSAGSPGDRFGWAVPAAGCRAASAGKDGSEGGQVSLAGAPAGVLRLRRLRGAGCGHAGSCEWFVGLDRENRPVALVARSSADQWIRLGGERAFDQPR